MSVAEWTAVTGGLSNPSKMPGFAYGIPAAECHVGGRLRDVPGSTCSGCYALKGQYRFGNVQAAQYRRLESITDPRWVGAMSRLIERKCKREPWFRWHDSGDLQSVDHLRAIVQVCEATPGVSHWLPTREYRIVRDYLADGGAIPANLTIRFSAHMVDADPPATPEGVCASTVHTGAATGHACPAPKQGNECGSCRACWDRSVPNVSYHLH